MKFGETLSFASEDGAVGIKLYAAAKDFGNAIQAKYCEQTYYASATAQDLKDGMPTCVVNLNSMWCHVSYSGRSFLFTGDTIKKKTTALSDEPMDYFIINYGEELRADVVKYPHHGVSRNHAKVLVRDYLVKSVSDSYVLLSALEGTANAGTRLNTYGIQWHNSYYGKIIYTVSEAGVLSVSRTPDSLTYTDKYLLYEHILLKSII